MHQDEGNENRKNVILQKRLGEPSEQSKNNTRNDLCENNTEIFEKYYQYLQLKYYKKTTIQNYYYHVRLFLKWIGKPVEHLSKDNLLE